MSDYFYSADANAFYAAGLQELYQTAGTWPGDAVSVDNSVYEEFSANDAPVGMYRIAGGNGLPEWAVIPAPTHDALTQEAESKKVRLMAEANTVIAPLERAVKLGIETETEVALLEAWERYSVLLNRVKASTAPDIEWPEVPQDVA